MFGKTALLLSVLVGLRGGGVEFIGVLKHIMKKFPKKYEDIITFENIFQAWKEFVRDKSKKTDVILFGGKLMDNLSRLYEDLIYKKYKHSTYHPFKINDPKPRDIHKAIVRDRVLHHLLYTNLYPFFDRTFIHDSYSCRIGKGTHKALLRFRSFVLKVSKNRTKQCYVLKCDIRKCFRSIDHDILKNILNNKIEDKNILGLLDNVIDSFKIGLPLGNLTSQLLVNIYMNELDQHMKRELKVKYYIRYVDDFAVVSDDKIYLDNLVPKISEFLDQKLKLELHPDKLYIKAIYSGVDFLGWIESGDHRVLRTSTKKRMFRNIKNNLKIGTNESYIGMLKWGNTYKIKKIILK
jgi:retron-type reverse transcriptase